MAPEVATYDSSLDPEEDREDEDEEDAAENRVSGQSRPYRWVPPGTLTDAPAPDQPDTLSSASVPLGPIKYEREKKQRKAKRGTRAPS